MSENVHWPTAAASDFEERHNISIFTMRDFGSQAKNMAGPKSDRDAMFLFDQPSKAHKRLGEYVDTIDTEEYGIDFHGWNVRKFADLLADSNPQAIEFLHSDIEYYPEKHAINGLLEELQRTANRNFNPIRLYMHYRSMAENNYRKYIEKEKDRTVRRNLKVVRAALYARHIRRTKSYPAMDFRHFLDHSVGREIEERVLDMLEAKEEGLGDVESGNPFKDIIEYEINYEPDHESLNERGIDKEVVNDFLDRVDHVLFPKQSTQPSRN